MAIAGGYRVHEGTQKRYRVPDLLTEDEFKDYMASIYGVTVDFRSLTEDEQKKLDSGERLSSPATPEPLDSDVELARLREALGIVDIEERLKIKRDPQAEKRDPIVELDSKILPPEEFEAKYGVSAPKIPEQGSSTKTASKK